MVRKVPLLQALSREIATSVMVFINFLIASTCYTWFFSSSLTLCFRDSISLSHP